MSRCRITSEVLAAVVHLHKTGMTETDIAAELGLDALRVHTVLRRRRLRFALRSERRWLAISVTALSQASGVSFHAICAHEHGAMVRHFETLISTLAEMRGEQLRQIADKLSDRGEIVRHVLDVAGVDDLDDALDAIRVYERFCTATLSLRNRKILCAWIEGDTYEELAARFGLSRARIGGIVSETLGTVRNAVRAQMPNRALVAVRPRVIRGVRFAPPSPREMMRQPVEKEPCAPPIQQTHVRVCHEICRARDQSQPTPVQVIQAERAQIRAEQQRQLVAKRNAEQKRRMTDARQKHLQAQVSS